MSDSDFVIDDLTGKTESEREVIAAKVGKALSQDLDKVERAAVEKLSKVLAMDTAENVRQSLVKEVLNCPYLPIEIATQIANDVSTISKNFLHNYDSGDDAVLEELARECEEKAREVLATRHGLPEPASFAISEVGGEGSISNLMENKTAVISERVCSVVTDRFKDNPSIMENMSRRADLPLNSVAKIIEHLGDEVASGLIKKYELGEDLAHYISGQAKLAAMEGELNKATITELEVYYRGLDDDGLLNNGMLLQILKSGNIGKFSVAVSIRTGIDADKVIKIINSQDKGNFFRLMEKMKVTDALAGIIYEAYLEALTNTLIEDEDEQK